MEGSDNASFDAADALPESRVKERCSEQRWALPGEPQCVICGRYGEYICDQTDDDICSIQCKNTLLSQINKKLEPESESKLKSKPINPHVDIHATDECYYVSLTSDQISSLRDKMGMSVKGDSIPDPILSFSSCNFPPKLEQNIESTGYVVPTPVQMQAIPAVLSNRNVIVSAETGSGKTASFLIPVISNCMQVRSQLLSEKKNEKFPLAIVLSPTRELCVQIEEQAKVLGKGLPFKTALVVGGDPMVNQIYRINNGVEVIIGTPGRLIDLLTKHEIDLSEVSVLVLDEADCLMQKGFKDQVFQILTALSNPQILMFSATVSPELEKSASSVASNLIYISCGRENTPNRSVRQIAIWVESKQKKTKLFEILTSAKHFTPPAVVFVGSRIGADLLSEAISVNTGLKAISIHGEKTMKERREGLKRFLTGEVPVIVSTGVLGRGMDLVRVKLVIIFDLPNSIEEYVHQVGRASRMGAEGSAFVFVCDEDKSLFCELARILKSAGAVIPAQLANSKYLTTGFFPGNHKNKRKFGS